MKTSRPTVHLVLNKAKKNKQGKCPILLRIQYSGRINRSTGCSTRPSDWDSRTESVKSSDADYQSINSKIHQIKSDIIERMNHYETRGLPYSVQMLLDDKVSVSKVFSDVLDSMVKVKGLSHNTAAAYKASLHRLEKHFGVGFSLESLTNDTVKGCASSMKRSGMSDSTINVTLSCLKSVLSFAKSQGLYDVNFDWKYWRVFKINERRDILTEEEIRVLINDFVNQCVVADVFEGRWCYTDKAERDLMNRNSELFAQASFLMSYFCQGMAFCDLVRIKAENISTVTINKEDYYRISGVKRKKTNKTIDDILILQDEDSMPLFEVFIRSMDLRQDYLIPVLQNNRMEYNYDTEKRVSETTGTASVMVNRKLKSVFRRLGMNFESLTLYAARHCYATHYIANGGNPVYLADMLGRNVNGIFRYVNGLSSKEQNIRERSRVFGKTK